MVMSNSGDGQKSLKFAVGFVVVFSEKLKSLASIVLTNPFESETFAICSKRIFGHAACLWYGSTKPCKSNFYLKQFQIVKSIKWTRKSNRNGFLYVYKHIHKTNIIQLDILNWKQLEWGAVCISKTNFKFKSISNFKI